jgi:prepilin-type processing-associated H-X9-DG protein
MSGEIFFKGRTGMYCPKCGTDNPEDAQVCSSCSSTLPAIHQGVSDTPTQTSGLAIASLILGLLSFCTFFTTGIVAIVLGVISLVKISKSGGRLKGNGFAIAGIAVPAVSAVFMVPLMLGILMPALVRTQQIASRMICGNNLSELGKMMLIYAGDYDEKFPTPSKWCDILNNYAEINPKTFRCRGASEGPCNYAININIEKLNKSSPPDMVLMFETHPGWNQAGGPEILTTDYHENEGCNILFADLHVEFVRVNRLEQLRWKPN